MSDQNLNQEIIRDFLVESYERIGVVSHGLTQLEKSPQQDPLLHQLYRAVHTIKGAACFLGFVNLQTITHSMENLLDLIREHQVGLQSPVIDLLFKASDMIHDTLKIIEANGNDQQVDPSEMAEELNMICENKDMFAPLESPIAALDAEPTRAASEELFTTQDLPAPQAFEFQGSATEAEFAFAAPLEQIQVVQDFTQAQETIVKQESTIEHASSEPAVVEVSSSIKPPETKQLADAFVRVNVTLLDKIMNVVGELVLNRNQILQFANQEGTPGLQRLANQLNNITSELQSDIMTTRMQPVGNVLSKFERIVRDLGKETQKKIDIEIEGKDTELDKTLLEAMKDPLTHLIRNAVDHALEFPEERVQAGKSETGKIKLKAYHEGGQVTLEISDDGRGLPRSKILKKAIEKKLISEDEAQKLSDKQIFNLIFLPGFSTAEKVTNLSGRGVGMDVVKTNVEKIGGSIDVQSTEGRGTTFKLKIPLTLAIIPALIVKCQDDFFAIPQVNLVELVCLEGKKLELIESIQDAEFFRLRGDLLPLLRLSQVLQKSSLSAHIGQRNSEEAVNIIVLNADGRSFGLIVDAIEDTVEIVVKPLSHILSSLPFYAGATIMGDGHVALILDTLGLALHAHLEQKSAPTSESVDRSIQLNDHNEYLTFSLFDHKTYAIPLTLVKRLEEFPTQTIEYVGKQKVVRYRDQVMPLIDLNATLAEVSVDYGQQNIVSVLVVTVQNRNVGFIVKNILDIARSNQDIHPCATTQSGLLGSVFLDGKTIAVIDFYAYLDQIYRQPAPAVVNLSRGDKTVLVVEDSPFFRRLEYDALSGHGYKVLLAEDGQEALGVLKQQQVHLIVSDIEMPNMNGWDLARAVRSNQSLAGIPMVAVTTRFSEADQKTGNDAGYNAYLEKFKREDILNTVDSLLRLSA